MNPDLISDYAVIGAGIAGASVAYRLSAHASVIVLEREAQPGYHSTGRSAAMFMETYGTPQIQALTRASRAFYENPPEGFTEHPLLHPRGVLYVATAEQRDLLQQTYDEFRRHSDNVRLIEPQAAAARALPARRAAVRALEEPDARDIDVHGLHQGFLRGMRARGATLRANAELRAASHADGVWTLTLADGATARARHHQRGRRLGRSRGRAVRRRAGRPAALPPHRLHLQRSARRGFLRLAGGGGRRRKLLLQARRRSAAGLAGQRGSGRGARRGAGGTGRGHRHLPHRGSYLADDTAPQAHLGRPALLRARRRLRGWLGRGRAGLFWLAAQGGYGIQTAAAASELAAALVERQPVPDALRAHGVDARAMRPGRLR